MSSIGSTMASRIPNPNSSEMPKPSPLAFIFHGNEMIVQCTANKDDQVVAVKLLEPVVRNYQ